MRKSVLAWVVVCCLACGGGIGNRVELTEQLVELHRLPAHPARMVLIRFVEHAILDCRADSFPQAPCRNLLHDLRRFDAAEATDDSVQALIAEHPNFALPNEDVTSAALQRLRKHVDEQVASE